MDKKAAIYKTGKELFISNGFKQTNVAEIMKTAGMATGTFYNYYPSKDVLFMEIFLDENVVLKKSILSNVDTHDDPMKVMQQMMMLNYQGMMSNPILREWYNREIYTKIEKAYREEKGLDKVNFLYDHFIEVIQKWQEAGQMRNDIDADMIMALFSAIIKVDEFKEEIGIQYFPKLMEYLAEFVMKGLMVR